MAISAGGNTLWVATNPYGLNVNASFAAAAQGQVRGLSGPSGDQSGNAVVTASGQKLTTDQLTNYATLYHTFADSWRISQADSLFTDRPGEDATAFNDPTFPDPNPAPIPAADLAAANAACSGYGFDPTDLADCETDVASTGDAGFASALAASSGSVPGATVGTAGTASQAGPTISAGPNSLQPGQTVSGNLSPGATKTYPFAVTAGTVGYFAAAPNCNQSTSANVLYTVANADGSSFSAGRYSCDDVGRVVFPDAGTYELLVRSPSGVGGSYSVTWKTSRPDRVRALLAGQTATGTIELPGAQDVWTMAVPAGAVAYFAADHTCDTSTSGALLYSVRGSDGSAFSAGRYICDDIGRVAFPNAGTYQLTVTSQGGATRSYSITWEVSRADRALSLQPGQSASGTIDLPGAKDIWTFTVPAGTVAYLDADPKCTAASGNLLYEVQDASGASVGGARYICDSLGRVTFDKTGTYRLIVSSVNGATKSYTILWKDS